MAENAKSLVTVYMPLLDEGTDVLRPVLAETVTGGLYRVLGPTPEDEIWQFRAGSVVRCATRKFGDGSEGLVPFEAVSVTEAVPGEWLVAHIGYGGDDFELGGLKVWSSEWKRVNAPRVILPHPAYLRQMHEYRIYEIGPGDHPVRFATSELSNGVWGFYVPAT